MVLEQQLARLAELGFRFDHGVTVDDILYSFDRDDYEKQPFDLILFVLGIEVERAPWGRSVCSRVWNFDLECINATSDYVQIVKRLCEVASQPDRLKDVKDFVDVHTGKAWLKYTIDGTERHWSAKVNNDWADPLVVDHIMEDIEHDSCFFYFMDNGQAMVLFYLDPNTATKLNQLSSNALKRVLANQ